MQEAQEGHGKKRRRLMRHSQGFKVYERFGFLIVSNSYPFFDSGPIPTFFAPEIMPEAAEGVLDHPPCPYYRDAEAIK